MLNKVLSLSVAATLLSASGIALAVTAVSSAIPVSATVSQACSISTTSALAFGAYDPVGVNASAALNATGQISVTCSKGASGLTVGMGLGSQPAGAQRQMKGVLLGLLNYNIFQPPSNVAGTACTFPGTIAWNDTGAGLLTLAAAPSKVARLYNVCGTIPGGQDVTVDSYADVVSATLNF
jgi:spore coat protein U-like protein